MRVLVIYSGMIVIYTMIIMIHMSVIQSNTRQWSESKWYYELKMQNENME
ncbi:MAG: hypothetical protein MR675_11210 [Lachnospira sp.]|nr:hypothetical protein [Lachnospira sp.]